MYEFPATGPINANIRAHSGTATIVAEERTDVAVEIAPYDNSDSAREAVAQTRVEMRGDSLVIEPPSSGGWLWRRGWRLRITARVPLDSTLHLRSASADVQVDGRWAEANANTASGNIRIGQVTGSLSVHSASGRVDVAHVGGALKANTASGDLFIGGVGEDAVLHSASGDIRINDAGRSVTARTASGDVEVRQARRGEVRAQTASGDVLVGVATGTAVLLDVITASGATRTDLDVGDTPPTTSKGADLSVIVRTASGDVSVVRAAGKPSYT